ncbi:MAG: hypothetical protein H8D87_00620 [Deltaproteobacteria bacterium]|nr:hypothetical protein [Candidatus Desulfobacula maris]
MKISLLTDAPKHNLALMKLSAWHKANGDEVMLNAPIFPADYIYASVLFEKNKDKLAADEYGGPAFPDSILPKEIEEMIPDYSLFGLNYSLGYTFRPCFNTCDFCKVPKMNHPQYDITNHHSIWDFHIEGHETICILNNNTFQDRYWKDTFEEIWAEDLFVIDENGYDLRLLDDEKADALHKTKFKTPIHFAWDRMQDEALIVNGLRLLNYHKMRSTANGVYVLIGYNTTEKEDLHRCQIIHDYGLTPYPMPYVKNNYTSKFKRFINLHYYRQYSTIEAAWRDYK